MFTNQMRMTGFSGIDVGDMVTQMMRAESMRLDRLRQNRDLMVWQRDQMRGVSASVLQFRNRFLPFATLNRPDSIRRPENFNALSANLTAVGGATGLTATATQNAQQGNHTINVYSTAQTDMWRTAGNLNTGLSTDRIDLRSFIQFTSGNPNASPPVAASSSVGGGTFQMSVNNIVRSVNLSHSPFDQGGNLEALRAQVHANRVQRDTMLADMGAEGLTAAQFLDSLSPADNDVRAALNALIDDPNNSITVDNLFSNHMAAARRAVSEAFEAREVPWEQAAWNAIGPPANVEAAFTALASNLNTELNQVFGVNAGTAINRVIADVYNGQLRIRASEGNTADVRDGVGPRAVSIFQMGFAERGVGTRATSFDFRTVISEFGGDNADFTINGVRFTIDNVGGGTADRTITIRNAAGDIERTIAINDRDINVLDVYNAINASSAGVRLSFSAINGQITMESLQSGASNNIVMDDNVGNFLGSMFNAPPSGLVASSPYNVQQARDAVVTINGGAQISRETNNFTLEGINIVLTAAADPNGGPPTVFNVEVVRDPSSVRDLITNFIEAYNEMIRSITDLTEVRRPRQGGSNRGAFFLPLTEEQRRAMSDREIELWEAQAKTGILHRDDALRGLMNDMRNAVFNTITLEGGQRINITMMGIRSTEDIRGFGQLEIRDEEMFENFLLNNPELVEQMFTAFQVREPGQSQHAWMQGLGIAERLEEVMRRAVSSGGSLFERAGIAGHFLEDQNVMSNRINAQERRIDNMLTWLERRESQLFAQFSRMEVAMMQAQSQMMFFEQMLWQ